MIRNEDDALLAETIRAVETAGKTLLARFRTTPPPTTLADLLAGIEANDAAVEDELRQALLASLPGSSWASDEEEQGKLPSGDWWVVDPAEGNVNHLHGRSGWAVTATLVREGEPILTAISVPLSKAIIMLGAGLILLPGCKPAANDATALLKAGDARICVAPEVEDTLREMIAPKPDLAKAYSVTFSDATLESYDPQVHKALCNTRVTVQGPGGGLIDHAPLNISVSPSARDDGQFLVTAQGIDAYHQQLVDDNAERAEQAASEEADKVAEEKLTALVKSGWLIGRWVGAKAGSDACSQKGYFGFVRGGVADFGDGASFRWTMQGRRVSMIGPSGSLTFDITDADNDTMSTLYNGSETQDFRRCAPSEIQSAEQFEKAVDALPAVETSDDESAMPSQE